LRILSQTGPRDLKEGAVGTAQYAAPVRESDKTGE
jgi:hypothetical protein